MRCIFSVSQLIKTERKCGRRKYLEDQKKGVEEFEILTEDKKKASLACLLAKSIVDLVCKVIRAFAIRDGIVHVFTRKPQCPPHYPNE